MTELSPENMEPVFNGLPVIVRLTNGDDVICLLYQPYDTTDPRLVMERPLQIIVEETVDSSDLYNASSKGQTVYAKVRTRFDRWMPLTDMMMFPVYPDHIISIAPAAKQFINPYMEWAEQLYDTPFDGTASPASSSAVPTNSSAPVSNTGNDSSTVRDTRESYFDFILHNYTPKGKPN